MQKSIFKNEPNTIRAAAIKATPTSDMISPKNLPKNPESSSGRNLELNRAEFWAQVSEQKIEPEDSTTQTLQMGL